MTQPLGVGTVLNNRYRIVRLVGGGGMAYVYQVEELPAGSGRLWALKELRPQSADKAERDTARQLFDQEAGLLRQLNHPNIPKIAEFFETDGHAYLVMEFIFGESLEKRLRAANAPLLENDVLSYAAQLCEALTYLHGRTPPIIFRDLKPSNAMVTATGQVKLIDFGIARTYKRGKKRDTVAMGSENYAAPEQWGKGQTDARSDVYALGATMYHLLANMAPTPAFLPSEPLPLANYNGAVSKATIAIVDKAMAREREARFQTAQEMRDAIVAAMPMPYMPPPAVVSPQVAPVVQAPAKVPAGREREAAPPKVVPRPVEVAPASSPPRERPAERPAPAVVPAGQAAPPVQMRVEPSPASQPAAAPPVAPIPAPSRPCPACGGLNREGARFCVHCGQAFIALPPAVLRIVEPVRAAWEMPVSRSPMLLGRASEAEGYRPDFDMTFYDDDGYVSRRHAQITRQPGSYAIADLGSSNGTTVNGRPLLPNRVYPLRNGDRVQVGLVVIEFRLR